MVDTHPKPEDVTDTTGIEVGFDNAENEWDALELRLNPAALDKESNSGKSLRS